MGIIGCSGQWLTAGNTLVLPGGRCWNNMVCTVPFYALSLLNCVGWGFFWLITVDSFWNIRLYHFHFIIHGRQSGQKHELCIRCNKLERMCHPGLSVLFPAPCKLHDAPMKQQNASKLTKSEFTTTDLPWNCQQAGKRILQFTQHVHSLPQRSWQRLRPPAIHSGISFIWPDRYHSSDKSVWLD